MADEGSSLEERTEEASQHRRDEWRREGRVAYSRELSAALLSVSIIGVLYIFPSWIYRGMSSVFETYFTSLDKFGTGDLDIAQTSGLLSYLVKGSLMIGLPIMIAAVVVGILGSVFQVGFLWTTKPIEPDLDKINPQNGLSRIFGAEGFFEFFKAILKFILAGALVYFFVLRKFGESSRYWGMDAEEITYHLGKNIFHILILVAGSMLILSIADYAFQKFRYEQKIKMTKEEAKQERKSQEGNPQIKARIRAIQRSVASRRMMDAVKKADVVVTNPTHFAVAILYDKDNMDAPKIVAKGVDHLALKIKEIAREAGVPVVENPPLARALYKALKIGQMISRDMFNAVAEVLAYVYRLKGKDSL